jgi:hypothetical protein
MKMPLQKKKEIAALAVALAMMLLGNGCAVAPEVLAPSCAQPAWLDGKFDPGTPGYVVMFTEEVDDVIAAAQDLARKHSFALDGAYQSAVKGFGVEVLTPRALADVRCDPRVLGVSFNERIRIGSHAL